MPDIEANAPLSPSDAAHAARLLTLAHSLGVDPTDLDEAVHDAAARYASDECNATGSVDDDDAADEIYDEAGQQAADKINNQGIGRQVPYLVAQYGHKDTERFIREAAPRSTPGAAMLTSDQGTPETRAASLFVAAFTSVFAGGPRMTIALHMSSGSSLAVVGELADSRMRFHPAEVSTLLAWLTQAVAYDPLAVITVTADTKDEALSARGWAWCIGTGAALNTKEAAKHLHDDEELRGAENRHITLSRGRVDTSTAGLSATALTHDVKTVITAHAEPPKPTTGHQIALRTDGTITFHITAANVPAARAALADLDCEDFDVNLPTRPGHLIGHITVLQPDAADLISVNGVPADELSDNHGD